jgi:hypothetical protein
MLIDDFKVAPAERGTVQKKLPLYLANIIARTTVVLHPRHPRHHGIPMQAHHAISAKGVSLSDRGPKLEDFGYDINHHDNLVFLPSSLKGACMLQVQPHRGDHTAKSILTLDNDKDREDSYHFLVSTAVNETYRHIGGICGSDMSRVKAETQKAMDKLSAKFIRDIQRKPSEVRLTKISEHFVPGNSRGCGGMTSVNDVPKTACPNHRNHTGQDGITFMSDEPYKLKPGL